MLNIQKLLSVIPAEERKKINSKQDLISLLTKYEDKIKEYDFYKIQDKTIIYILNKSFVSIKGKYILFHYGTIVQVNYLFNNLVKELRGVILDKETLKIKHFPFEKFFNYSEILDFKELLKDEYNLLNEALNNSISFTAVEKIDGSLGLLWYNDEEKK